MQDIAKKFFVKKLVGTRNELSQCIAAVLGRNYCLFNICKSFAKISYMYTCLLKYTNNKPNMLRIIYQKLK